MVIIRPVRSSSYYRFSPLRTPCRNPITDSKVYMLRYGRRQTERPSTPTTPTATAIGLPLDKRINNFQTTIPGLQCIAPVNPAKGSARLILFSHDQTPERSVLQIGELKGPCYSALELIAVAVQSYKEATGNSENKAHLLLSGGEIEVFKYGTLLFCFSEHFFARFCYDTNLWWLEGLSDGERGDAFYPIQSPPGESIVMSLSMGTKGLRVQEVKRMAEAEQAILRATVANKSTIDLFRPRKVAGPQSAIQRVYATRGSKRIHSMTRDRIYEFQETAGAAGFYPTITTTIENLPAQVRCVRHHIAEDFTIAQSI